MYKFDKNHQFGLADFNQPMGLKMNPENRWVKKAETIPWEAIEEKYAALFPSKKGMPAKPLRTALCSLLIQKKLQFSDRELVEEIREKSIFSVLHRTSWLSGYHNQEFNCFINHCNERKSLNCGFVCSNFSFDNFKVQTSALHCKNICITNPIKI